MPPIGSSVMTADGLGKVSSINFLSNSVAVKLEDGKIKDYAKNDIDVVDADVNVEIEPTMINYHEEGAEHIDLKQLEDDRNSSTGNI